MLRIGTLILIALCPMARAASDPGTAHAGTSTPISAVAEAERKAGQAPDSASAWAQLAAARFANGEFEGAEEAARKALLLNPSEADALVAMARCLETSGHLSEAGEHLKQALESVPNHPAALRLMAGHVDLNTQRELSLSLTRRFVDCNPPDQQLFVEHARQMLRLVALLGPTQLSVRPAWEACPERLDLPLHLDAHGVSIELQLGDQKRLFCLDTGEESITVRAETAKALGFKALAEIPAVTAAGVGRMPIVLAPRFGVDGYQVENLLVSLGAVDVVGPSFFSEYRIQMNFDDRKLILIRQPKGTVPGPKDLIDAAPGTSRHRFRRLGNLIWVPVSSPSGPARLQARPAWGLLDTGCQYPAAVTLRYLNALRSERGRGPLALPFQAEVAGADGVQGKPVLFYALKDFQLEFLGTGLSADGSAATASFGDISKTAEAEMDLLIGWPLIHRAFKRIEIDFQRCLLTVEPRTSPLPPVTMPRFR